MIGWTIGVFAVAAVGGAIMLWLARVDQPIPLGLAVLHGALAATGLVLLTILVLQGSAAGLATVSLVVFVVAALGGFVLFAQHLGSGSFPVPLGMVHGVAAVTGFALLLVWALG